VCRFVEQGSFMNIRKISAAVTAAGAVLVIQAGAAQAQGTLRIGMTAADIPKTHGQPDQGFEGNRFTGIPMFDGLTQWDL
jgi:peptide/nickel transport system substrate-binding protein